MTTPLTLTLVTVFVAAAFIAGALVWLVMTRPASASRRRLHDLVQETPSFVVMQPDVVLIDAPEPVWDRMVETLPTSRGSAKRLRRDVLFAGFHSPQAPAMFSIAEIVLPLVLAALPLLMLTGFNRWFGVVVGVGLGYLAPGVFLGRRIAARKKEIENGLADALDLLVLCLEAGTSLDQALVKAGEELRIAYPALGDQLQIVISEMRAGKPRLEAFRGLAARTQVDDVRALVTMLVQTDRFGTSIAQALRTHASVCRTKRRQRAEERAQKVGVKLVFPLVFCLFPALYVVLLGPAFIQFGKMFGGTE